ncbi:helicase-related protein [Geodermatophilus sp. DSM 45219]|uniref:helicase-related protein n=1 Tax=Geodermatophilus sp. DSM 45219 TaxID=1881103 RepID=UPI001C408E18|nr:helicase-related protein [Geodermatophilus sp. DSM 45219]
MTLSSAPTDFAVGSLVRARGREWVVLPGTAPDFLLLQPLGGSQDDVVGVFPDEGVEPATFPTPTPDDLGDAASTELLRTALRVGFQASAGPFRSLAGLSVSPRNYQYVPLLLALRQDIVRLLIADDVGIGKTIEAGMIAAELLAQGTVKRLAVLCSPALAEQWQRELREKFGIDAALVLTSSVKSLERGLMLNESLFDRHPFVIVSSDFIKSDRRRHEFVLRCPELVIVDEAHNSVASGGAGQRARHQRYELLQSLAADETRHLILTTATPHSGDETAFTNLIALCNPALATADLTTLAGRSLLARHFVQRRRADIRHYLDEDTPFPSDRQTRDEPYTLSPQYRDLFEDVLAYAREQVREGANGVRGRVRWWSALALLRALASSPSAAAATLRTRAANADVPTVTEVDFLGRAGVLDSADEEMLEGLDITPGALVEDDEAPVNGSDSAGRRRLQAFARRAAELDGPAMDRKLALLIAQVKKLLADGYAPIVFCRFIDTADYVGKYLGAALSGKRGREVNVGVITGQLPPAEREHRVQELVDKQGQHVLVATDCLSEGVNLQDAFSAVLHYDLAWNPTRHEQREGRVDRFGQRRDVVRALTLYGEDNGIDGIVLDVLIRKHRAIAKATGVAVPVPGNGDGLIDALAEGLLLRGRDAQQLTLDLQLDERTAAFEKEWQSAAEKEKTSRARFAQHAIKPEDVVAEVDEVRAALGTHGDLRRFLERTLRALGSTVTNVEDGFTAVLSTLPLGLWQSLPVGLREPLLFRSEPPAGREEAVIARTDPTVQTIARYVLETALDAAVPERERPARRAGVMRTDAVQTRTTLLLVRFRFQLTLPTSEGVESRVAEDARLLAFEGAPTSAVWLPDQRAEALLGASPTANLPADAARLAAQRVLDGMTALMPYLENVADEHADRLLGAHRRARAGAGAARRGLSVTAQRPIDVLSLQVLLPSGGAPA